MTTKSQRSLPADAPLLMDLCSGGGLAADGYANVGLRIGLGIDVVPQPHYPYPHRVADAFDVLETDEPEDYEVLHASWPCQFLTRAKHLRNAQGGESKWPDLLTPGLDLMRRRWGHKVWIVENVEDANAPATIAKYGAPLMPGAVRCCGSSFGLGVRRHRLFLSNVPLVSSVCHHKRQGRPWGVYHVSGDSIPQGGRTARDVAHGVEVMGVDRPMPWDTLKEGFPPVYTEWIGAQVRAAVLARRLEARA